MKKRWTWSWVWFACVMTPGCGGDAGVELASSDALLAVADRMEMTIGEYHREVSAADTARESQVVAAFVVRARTDAVDETAMSRHVSEFQAALAKIREDRETEWQRRAAAGENVGVLREIARGLQRIGIESLSLRDEVRRYLTGWIETRRRAANAGQPEAK